MNRMKKTLCLLLSLQALWAVELDSPSVNVGAGYESISVLDKPALDIVAGANAYVLDVHPQFMIEGMFSYSVIKAKKEATSTVAEYSVGIMNIGAYAGYMLEFDSPFLIKPKIGANLAYASITQKYAISIAYGATLLYDSIERDMMLYVDITKAGDMVMFGVGVSIPIY